MTLVTDQSFSLTLTRAAGSMKTVGCATFGLNRLSAAKPSSAVSLSALSTSRSNSMRPTPRKGIVLDTRRSSSECDEHGRAE